MSAAAWPALPRPGELVRLPLLAPPLLLEALDYRGEARYVAFRWSGGSGGDVLYSDGTTTAAGWWPAWLLLVREHPLGRVIFDRYELGHHDDPGQLATHWLLADRWQRTLDIGLARDVEQLLATQPSALGALAAELGPERAAELLRDAFQRHAAHPPAPEEIHARLERQRERLDELRARLDELAEQIRASGR